MCLDMTFLRSGLALHIFVFELFYLATISYSKLYFKNILEDF